MNERGAYVSEWIVCDACLAGVRQAIAEHCPNEVTIETPASSRIVGGMMVQGSQLFDLTLREPIEARICHPVRIAVVRADSRHDAILMFDPAP